MLLENFYNELMYYLQERLNTLTEIRNATDDEIEHLVCDSAVSTISGVIVQMQKIKLLSTSPCGQGGEGQGT